jgi:hypothetical protein
MTLENQVCSLELAKRLKELGVKQESLFWHVWDGERDYFLYHNEQVQVYEGKTNHILMRDGTIKTTGGQALDKCSAFTVAELLEGMPRHIDLEDGTRSFLVLDKYRTDDSGTNYSCGYHPRNGKGFNAGFCDEKNFVEAVGLMKVYLIEHKLITL